MLVGGPWMVRASVLSGNPVAPLFNRWFENAHFHVSTEESVRAFLRAYDVSPAKLPLEITVLGAKTGGLVGPVFLLLPVALLALRKREGRWVWMAAIVAAIPWFLNAGTRFAMPALVFASIALAMSLPKRAAWALAMVQMVAAWPHVLDLWTGNAAWRLRGMPWQAALRIEPEQEYLRRTLLEYRVAEMLQRHTRRGDRILDLEVAPASAYFDAVALTPWQSAAADRSSDALRIGLSKSRDAYWTGSVRWEKETVKAVRIRLSEPAMIPNGWSFQDVTLLDEGKPVFPSQEWQLEASRNVWETGLAFDRNPVSRWRIWQEAHRGEFLAIHFRSPRELDGARVLVFEPPRGLVLTFDGLAPDGLQWKTLAEPAWRSAPALNYREQAMSMVRREGFRYILTRAGDEGLSQIGRELIDALRNWGLEKIADAEGVYLLKLSSQEPTQSPQR
jgi:hypothetical protein